MSNILKFQATHGIVGNAPATINVAADDPVLMTREFSGVGAPAAATLQPGKGRYCAANSGFVIAATLVAPGVNYKVGDILIGGSGFAITLDAVTGAGGIADYHVSSVGNYAAYPANPLAMLNGSGSGATFNLAFQPADHYFDTQAKTLYACTTSGTNATSVWAPISGAGGGAYGGTYVPGTTYSVGAIVRVQSTVAVNGTVPTLGVFGCIIAVPAGATGVQVPQFPEPVGACWQMIAPGIQAVSSCQGGTKTIYIAATAPF